MGFGEDEDLVDDCDTSDDDANRIWAVDDFTDLIGTTHYESEDDAVYDCNIIVRRCILLKTGKWGKELKSVDKLC